MGCRAIFVVLSMAALLAGCAGVPITPVGDPEAAWRQRLADLAAREDWDVGGRVAIQIDGRGWNANLDWQQRSDGYHLNLFGPFGKSVAQVRGDETGVTLTTSERVSHADTADALVLRELGWPLPVDGLRDWVLGRPARGDVSASGVDLDAWGRPSQLRQDGWEISYQRYRNDLALPMPDRIRLVREDVRVNLVIDTWRLLP